MRIIVNERRNNLKALRLHELREDLLPNDRLQAIQEELAAFFINQVIDLEGAFYYRT